MQGLSRKQKQLSEALLNLHEDAMLLEELDGFVTGLLVCPETIPPSAWTPFVWNREGGDEPVFENLAHANRVMRLVMEHYNAVAKTLFHSPDSYSPLFAVDERNGDVLWEIWIEGFDKAVKLRPEAWRPLLTADNNAARAWSSLMMLADVARAEERFSKEQTDALTATAHEKIPGWVRDLNDWRLAIYQPATSLQSNGNPFAAPAAKAGRNDPCPCGSGKTYKRCCGLN
jgi:uncharacterized protein